MAEILLVSDSTRFAEEMAPLLEGLGHGVTRSTSQPASYKEAIKARPRVLVLDMPSFGADAGRVSARLLSSTDSPSSVLAVWPTDKNPAAAAANIAQVADGLARRQADIDVNASRQDYGFMTVEIHRREVNIRGTRIPLTPTETHILSVLAANIGTYVPAYRLVEHVYGYRTDEREAGDIIRVHIHNLRQKLGRAGVDTPHILCGRGRGYILDRRSRPELALSDAAVAGD